MITDCHPHCRYWLHTVPTLLARARARVASTAAGEAVGSPATFCAPKALHATLCAPKALHATLCAPKALHATLCAPKALRRRARARTASLALLCTPELPR